jgi:glucose-6-phosphate 1-dehydrogenase
MMQNSLQLLTLIAMEPPGSLRADAIRNEKMKVLEAVAPCGMTPLTGVWCKQYAAGRMDDHEVAAYRQSHA